MADAVMQREEWRKERSEAVRGEIKWLCLPRLVIVM
jgi:hypothetical protein